MKNSKTPSSATPKEFTVWRLATVWLVLGLMAAIIALAIRGHWALAQTLGSLPVTLIVAILGVTIDVKRFRRNRDAK